MSRQTFELHGRQYDALTGAVMGQASSSHKQVQPDTAYASGQTSTGISHVQVKPSFRTPSVSIDGMTRRPQPTKTLMRRAVKPPMFNSGQSVSTAANIATPKAVAKPAMPLRGMAPSVIPKLSSSSVDPRRSMVAQSVSRSQSVQRFGATTSVQPVWNGTSATSVSGIALPPQAKATATSTQQLRTGTPAPRRHNTFAGPTRRPSMMPAATSNRTSQDDDQDIFTRALAEASSHEEMTPANIKTRKSGKRTRRILGVAASAIVFLGLAGFVGFQNRDDIRLQLASAKAGFPASAPLYKPDGYALAGMKYTAGSVASIYQHKGQDFTITQKKSNWDSQTLLENFVATSNGNYKGFQSNGRTVYVYGKGNATWVNGGIWYQIKATDNLSDDQLVRIAASM